MRGVTVAWLRRLLPAFLISVVVAPIAVAPATAATGIRPVSSPEYGASVFVYDQPVTTARDLDKVRALGFSWVKSLFRWTDIEHDYKGAFDWTESDRVVRAVNSAGLKLLARLDFQPWWARRQNVRNGPPDNPQDFADFVYAFARRYGEDSRIGRVDAIQIWNEPNLSREWGDQPITARSAKEYVRLLSMAYKAVKASSPGITVVSAGLAFGFTDPACCQLDDQYLREMYAAGLRGSYDALGLNANFRCACVGAPPGSVLGFDHPSYYFRRVEQLREIMVANGDASKQVWLTEFGWNSGAPGGTSPQMELAKGEQIVQAFQYARQHWSPWIGAMLLWTMADPAWNLQDSLPWDDEQAGWAVTNPDGSNGPAYDRLLLAGQRGELKWPWLTRP